MSDFFTKEEIYMYFLKRKKFRELLVKIKKKTPFFLKLKKLPFKKKLKVKNSLSLKFKPLLSFLKYSFF